VLLLLYSRLVLENKALASRIVTRRGVAFVIRGVAGSGHREEMSSREVCFVPMSEGNSCFLLRWGRFIMITKVLKPGTPVPIFLKAVRDASHAGAGNMPDTGARTTCYIGYNHRPSRII
jgi:hypothetical protein